ncbi:transcription antitermination factor NusB [Tuberibacillus sp. Marseille-P3662]|uniref:transcription antitermination factor NusB n=1 Tax=Tuberibacillus sp. Marseille-P3662 TaxID=1965358 RepID=UPI000A1CE506|nr:transcription antitermination factor NusB [Tuberibacillus sp. Marseille-P3662]
MKRREAREKAVQALFHITLNDTGIHEALDNVNAQQTSEPFIKELLTTTIEHRDTIDALIKNYLIHWQFDRLSQMDRTIMRLAICEICYFGDIPAGVSINEAVELAKKFSDHDAHKFINGILSKVANNHHE